MTFHHKYILPLFSLLASFLLISLLPNVCHVVNAFGPSLILLSNSLQTKSKESRNVKLFSNSNEHAEIYPTTKQPHIVILGGGFGGLNAAFHLESLPWLDSKHPSSNDGKYRPTITVIDQSERFVFRPLLYDLCMGDASLDEVAPTYNSLLMNRKFPPLPTLFGESSQDLEEETGISFLQAKVQGIDVHNQQVVVSPSSTSQALKLIDYDALVVATGADVAIDGIPGAVKYALPFYTVEQSLELRRRLAVLDGYLEERNEPVTIAIVGGSYSGVELALNLIDRLGGKDSAVTVILIHRGDQVLEYATEFNRNTATERLLAAGVQVMTSTSVVEVKPSIGESYLQNTTESSAQDAFEQYQCIITLTKSTSQNNVKEDSVATHLKVDLLLWTAGPVPTTLKNTGIRNSLLPRDGKGRILTSPTLNVPEFPNVFAIGDCTRPKKIPYPATAQVAIDMAAVAAWNIYASLSNKRNADQNPSNQGTLKLLPFSYFSLGEILTLGSEDATVSAFKGNFTLSGRGSSWLRRWIYNVRMPTVRQALTSAIDGTSRKLIKGTVARKKTKARSKR